VCYFFSGQVLAASRQVGQILLPFPVGSFGKVSRLAGKRNRVNFSKRAGSMDVGGIVEKERLTGRKVKLF